MKKALTLTMAALLCVASLTFLASCTTGGDNSSNSVEDSSNSSSSVEDNSDSSASDSSTSDSSASDSSASAGDDAITAFAKEQDDLLASSSTEMMEIHCLARGKSLVYTYTYDIDLDAATAQTSLDGLESTYSTLLSTVQLAVPDCESIIIEILGKDGSVLATSEFK